MAPPSQLKVWAVEPRVIQVSWGDLPSGEVRARTGSSQQVMDHEGGAGAIELTGLRPDTTYEIRIVVQREDIPIASHTIKGKTLPQPGGNELARIATISDLHIGTSHFGFLKTMKENPEPDEVFSVRCARSAIAAAQQWGANILVIKGDAVHHRSEEHFELLGNLVDEFPDLDMVLLPGNHDVDNATEIDLPDSIGARRLGFETAARAIDLPGVRLITTDTSRPGKGTGTIARTADDVLDLATSTPTESGVLLACHHQFQPKRIATHWPPGIPGPEANSFLHRLEKVAPRAFVTSGHTHRCRAYRRQSLQLTEVSSTSDYPGVWAGYIITEGGITQTVRRISTPSEMAWLEYSKGAVGGLWGKWSPGSLEERCLTHSWEGKS